MRLDKYLKVSRLMKRRTVAKDVAEKSKIDVNGKPVKPSYQLKIGDEIAIHYAAKTIIVKVSSLTVIKDHLMYGVIQA
ncbi:MAG: RNA-binding S4 domain-containing protein [Firmicutes bacterium]|nr:RNA-binding S4 domain-containing protein [Bacillota bacterium]